MSVYGNIIRENDEIIYMWNIFQHESTNDLAIFNNSDAFILEGPTFEKIKESISNFITSVIEKIKNFKDFLAKKFAQFIDNIKKKFNDIKNNNKKSVKQMYQDLEKEVDEEEVDEESEKELHEFLNRKTRLLIAPDPLQSYSQYLLDRVQGSARHEEHEMKYMERYFEKYNCFEDYIKERSTLSRGILATSRNDENTLSYTDLVANLNIEQDISKLEQFIDVNLKSAQTILNYDLNELLRMKKSIDQTSDDNLEAKENIKKAVDLANKRLNLLKEMNNNLAEYLSCMVSDYSIISKWFAAHNN